MDNRRFHLIAFFRDGTKQYLTSSPLTHAEACTMRSKFSNPANVRLEEVP